MKELDFFWFMVNIQNVPSSLHQLKPIFCCSPFYVEICWFSVRPPKLDFICHLQVPINSRGQAWASFDGKDRKQLSGGDALICQLSAWPVPAACDKESTTEFLRSVREGLHWNLRKSQLSDGPHNSY